MAFKNSIWNYLEHKISKKESESNNLRTEYLKNLLIETDDYAIASKKRKLDDAITAITTKPTPKLQEHSQNLLSLQPTRPNHLSYKSTNHKEDSKQQRNVAHYCYSGHSYVQRNKRLYYFSHTSGYLYNACFHYQQCICCCGNKSSEFIIKPYHIRPSLCLVVSV